MLDKKPTRYEEVAEHIIALIDRGVYKPGDKIPSLRDLSDSLHVSVNTIQEAYWLLEGRRFLEAVPQSGYFVKKRNEPPHLQAPNPATMDPDQVGLCRIYGAFQERGISEEDGCGLGIATLSCSMWPADKLQKCTMDAIRLHQKESMDYQLVPGYAPLREQIAIHGMTGGSRFFPDNIVITSGCQESVYLALASLTSPGDTVAVESPIYFNLLRLMESLHLKVLEIPCSPGEGMHLETLLFALDNYSVKVVLTIANFNNPTGSIMSDVKKEELVRMLSVKQIPLIEDDIYGDLYFGTERPRSCQSFDRDGTVLYCSSFSKTIFPGLRLGWIVPGRYREPVENLKNLINLGSSSLSQVSVTLFLQDGAFARHLKKNRARLKEKVYGLRDSVLRYFPAGTEVTSPEGGMVLWVCMPAFFESRQLYKKAREQNIFIAPGNMFSLQNRYGRYLRLNGGVWTAGTDKKIEMLGHMALKLIEDGDTREPRYGNGP